MLKRTPKTLLAITLVALALRLVFAGAVLGLNAPFRGDESDYHAIAANLAAGEGHVKHVGIPTAARPPLYSIALAGVYAIFGPSVPAARIFQVLLGALLVPLTYLLARRIFSQAVALIAAGVVALNPFLIFISAYLMTENLYTAILLLAMIVLTDALRLGFARGGQLVLAGLLAGAATLTRPHGLLFAAFTAAAVLVLGRGRPARRVLGAALFLLTLAAVLGPWVLRNEIRMGRPILLTTHGGITFYESNNRLILEEPAFRGAIVVPRTGVPDYDRRLAGKDELAFDREARRMGWEFVRENPGAMPKLFAWKFLRFWRFRSDIGFSGVKSGFWWDKESTLGALASRLDVGFVYNAVIIPLFVMGLILTLARRTGACFLHMNLLVHTIMALLFYGSLRARIPIEPVLAVYAAAGVIWLAGKVRPGKNTAPLGREAASADTAS